jgi:hypothetical protein
MNIVTKIVYKIVFHRALHRMIYKQNSHGIVTELD